MAQHSFLIIAIALSLPLSGQTGSKDIEIQRGTSVDRLVMASTDQLRTTTMLREAHLKIPLRAGGEVTAVLFTAHDTASHQFWWMMIGDAGQKDVFAVGKYFAPRAGAFVAADRFVVFWPQGAHLGIVERRGLTASTLDEAQTAAVAEVRRRAQTAKAGSDLLLGQGTVDVLLPQSRIPFQFWYPPNENGMMPETTEVVSVSRVGGNFRVILRNQWDQEVVLDDAYNFVSTRRLDSAAQPAKR